MGNLLLPLTVLFCLLIALLLPTICHSRVVPPYNAGDESILTQNVTFLKKVVFYCDKGTICEMDLIRKMKNSNMFDNSSHTIAGLNSSPIWMVQTTPRNLIGVSIHAGKYEYLLGYEDNNGQTIQLPIDVYVQYRHPPKKMFTLYTDRPSPKEFEAHPELLTDFVVDITQFFRMRSDTINVHDIQKWQKGSAITFHLSFLEEQMKNDMMDDNGELSRYFIRAMGPAYSIRKIVYGVCEPFKVGKPIKTAYALVIIIVVIVVLFLVLLVLKKFNIRQDLFGHLYGSTAAPRILDIRAEVEQLEKYPNCKTSWILKYTTVELSIAFLYLGLAFVTPSTYHFEKFCMGHIFMAIINFFTSIIKSTKFMVYGRVFLMFHFICFLLAAIVVPIILTNIAMPEDKCDPLLHLCVLIDGMSENNIKFLVGCMAQLVFAIILFGKMKLHRLLAECDFSEPTTMLKFKKFYFFDGRHNYEPFSFVRTEATYAEVSVTNVGDIPLQVIS